MTAGPFPDPLNVTIAIDEPALAERLTELLAGVPGVRLAAAGETSDVTVVASQPGHEAGGVETPLTGREQAVLLLLAEGASNKEIARRLGISAHTAKFHVGQLLEKLDASGRTDAVANAVRLGVIRL